MAQKLHHEYEASGGVTRQAIRQALAGLTDDDLSNSSPVTPGVPEAGIEIADGTVHLRVQGHDGDWTKTSEQAVISAIEDADGVEGLAESEGGYEGSS